MPKIKDSAMEAERLTLELIETDLQAAKGIVIKVFGEGLPLETLVEATMRVFEQFGEND